MSDYENITIDSWLETVHRVLDNNENLTRDEETVGFCDQVFESEINQCIKTTKEHYNKMMYREAFFSGFVQTQTAFKKYRELSMERLNGKLLMKFIEVQALLLAPLHPTVSEYVWTLLRKPRTIMYAEWPSVGAVDSVLTISSKFLLDTVERFQNQKIELRHSKKESHCVIEGCVVYVSRFYSPWQKIITENMRYQYEIGNSQFCSEEFTAELKMLPQMKQHLKKWLNRKTFFSSNGSKRTVALQKDDAANAVVVRVHSKTVNSPTPGMERMEKLYKRSEQSCDTIASNFCLVESEHSKKCGIQTFP